jgi:acyl-lipid Delta6-acetylenase / acyl-lipid (9-3)-desaturase
MYGFHSDKGMGMLKHLPRAKSPPTDVPPVSQATRNFREWRKQLVEDGWWDREWDKEAFNIGSWAVTLAAGICLAQFTASLGMKFAAVVVLGIANTIGGWLSHDYVHARGKFGEIMRPFGYFCGGMSTTWWSDKHNVHHARTNEVSIDEDIATDPALFLWAPDPKNDVPWRKFQGLYLPFPMSLLFLIWRFDSIKVAIDRKKYGELFGLACHYTFMLSLVPAWTFLGALLVSGFMTAIITTVRPPPHFHPPRASRRSVLSSPPAVVPSSPALRLDRGRGRR